MPKQREGPEAAVLLPDNRREDHVAAKLDPAFGDGPHGSPPCDESGLHVAGTSADDDVDAIALLEARGERITGPGIEISGRNDIGVAVDEERLAATGAREGCGDADGV
ncbi:unannotated protein [freshwater metagenome]|uniref:Unannotated protein n=1 Tax=freshwater metagenome TaxID=449393 RepID=A0A6J6TWT1_9ZZZZ